MKTVFTTLAAVLVTLCTVSTALGGNLEPAAAPTPKDASTASAIEPPQLYYSLMSNGPEAPRITESQGDIKVMKDAPLTITFKFTGSPMPEVTEVYRNGKQISVEGTYKIEENQCISYTLYIPAAELSDSGRYTFVIDNGVGLISHGVSVIVV